MSSQLTKHADFFFVRVIISIKERFITAEHCLLVLHIILLICMSQRLGIKCL